MFLRLEDIPLFIYYLNARKHPGTLKVYPIPYGTVSLSFLPFHFCHVSMDYIKQQSGTCLNYEWKSANSSFAFQIFLLTQDFLVILNVQNLFA